MATEPRWEPALPATGPAYGAVYVTDTATVTLNGERIELLRLSTGAVVVDAARVPELRPLVGRDG